MIVTEPQGSRQSLSRRAVAIVTLLFLIIGCQRAAPSADKGEQQLVVFAAASLRESFEELGLEFQRSHPNVKLTFNFAGTQELHAQIQHGAQADVFASANQKHMAELVRAGELTQPIVFAHNEPVIVASLESASRVQSIADLPGLARVVIGAAEVPIGEYTLKILERASLQLGADFSKKFQEKVVSRELNTRQVLTKVSLGEADAAIVYRTDAMSAGDRVRVVSIAPELNVTADYPMAILKHAPHPQLARAWVELIRSERGASILQRFGFTTPVRSGEVL